VELLVLERVRAEGSLQSGAWPLRLVAPGRPELRAVRPGHSITVSMGALQAPAPRISMSHRTLSPAGRKLSRIVHSPAPRTWRIVS